MEVHKRHLIERLQQMACYIFYSFHGHRVCLFFSFLPIGKRNNYGTLASPHKDDNVVRIKLLSRDLI